MVASDPLLLVLLGPTASGKTALSLTLAAHLAGSGRAAEIVSCDSVAVYRELEIGTAKPSPEERTRVPHHCLDFVSPATLYSAGDYQRDARDAIAAITAREHVPIVTGGTGLYLRALLNGLFDGPRRSEDLRLRLRRSAARHQAGWLQRLLRRLDPAAAERIHANDTPKLIRAIEVSLQARQPITAAWTAGSEPLTGYRILRLGLAPERTALYRRIDERAAAMFARGLIEETAVLMDRYGADARVLDTLGYRQARACLRGELSRDAAIEAARRGHRQFAKRQMTWFRREPDVEWLPGSGDEPAIVERAISAVAQQLHSSPNR